MKTEVVSVDASIAGVNRWTDLRDDEENDESDLWRRITDVAGEDPENHQPSLIEYANVDVLELRMLGQESAVGHANHAACGVLGTLLRTQF